MRSKGIVIKSQLSKSGRSINFQLKNDWYWYYAPVNKNANIFVNTDLTKNKVPIEVEWESDSGRWRKVTSIIFNQNQKLNSKNLEWTTSKLKYVREYCNENGIEEIKMRNKPFFKDPYNGRFLRAKTFYQRYLITKDKEEKTVSIKNKVTTPKEKKKVSDDLSRKEIDKTMKWALINNHEITRKSNVIYIKIEKGYKTISVAYEQNKDEINLIE